MKKDPIFFNQTDIEKRIKRLELDSQNSSRTFENFFVKGRLRTERAAPSSSTDVTSGDKLYDIVITTSYIYTLVNDSGNLRWRRVAISSF